MDPSKYCLISLLNMGGKILEKLLTNIINHYMYKNDLLKDSLGSHHKRVLQTWPWRQKNL